MTTWLTALALLPACGADDATLAKTSTSRTSTTTPADNVVTATTAIAAPPTPQGLRSEKWIDREVGDCLSDLPPIDPSVVSVTTVNCATPHEAEVYFRVAVGVHEATAEVANRECEIGLAQYTGQSIDGSPFAVTYLIDSNQDRTSANPEPSTVICVLHAANGRLLTRPRVAEAR